MKTLNVLKKLDFSKSDILKKGELKHIMGGKSFLCCCSESLWDFDCKDVNTWEECADFCGMC